MLPKVARGRPYNEKVDVYGMGMVMGELFSRSLVGANLPPDDFDATMEHMYKVGTGISTGISTYHVYCFMSYGYISNIVYLLVCLYTGN